MSFMGNRNINLQGIYVGGKEHFLVAILISCSINSKGNCVKTLLFLIEFLLVSILVMAFFGGGGGVYFNFPPSAEINTAYSISIFKQWT